MPTKIGYAAIVSYKTSNNKIGNFGAVRGVPYKIEPPNLRKIEQNKNLISPTKKDGEVTITIQCLPSGNCTTCGVEGTISVGGDVTYKCSCSECIAKVKISTP